MWNLQASFAVSSNQNREVENVDKRRKNAAASLWVFNVAVELFHSLNCPLPTTFQITLKEENPILLRYLSGLVGTQLCLLMEHFKIPTVGYQSTHYIHIIIIIAIVYIELKWSHKIWSKMCYGLLWDSQFSQGYESVYHHHEMIALLVSTIGWILKCNI